MKIPLNWISLYADISQILNKLGAIDLAHIYSISTAEIDDIIYFGKEDKILIGKIIEVKSHPDSNHLNITQVDLGSFGKTQIVCGAANVVNAIYVPVATIGAKLGEDFEIKNTYIRGIESNGMICSEDELGLQEERASGIMQLENYFSKEVLEKNIGKPFFDLKTSIPGLNGKKYEFSLKDVVFEIDNKFITNRPDLFSILGNAREFSTIFNLDFNNYVYNLNLKQEGELMVNIDSDKVYAYNLLKIDNVVTGYSPFGMDIMLKKAGLNPKFDTVDITNYIMTELGQPMHAFDADKIDGNITVRLAKNGEQILALDGQNYTLTNTDLVIADDKKVLAIAGIIGGQESAISETTKNIYVESACFDPVSVRITSQKLGVRTDSSNRYEKSLDPILTLKALQRFLEILAFLGKNGEKKGYFEFINNEKINNIVIAVSSDFIEKKLGVQISFDEIKRILNKLGFEFENKNEDFLIKVPSWRATKDISIKEDIVEEIGRIYSYDKIPETPLSGDFSIIDKNKNIELKNKINCYFSLNHFFEAYNYSFSSLNLDKKIGIDNSNNLIKITNAFNEEFSIMRRSLVPHLLLNIKNNIQFENEFSIFEIGKIFNKKSENEFEEKLSIAGVSINKDIEEIKSYLNGFIKSVIPGIKFEIIQNTNNQITYFHPNKSGSFIINNKVLINFGFINPIVANNFELNDNIIIFDIDYELLYSLYLNDSKNTFKEIAKFPGINRELNFVFDDKIPVNFVINKIKNNSDLIRNIIVLDIYRDTVKIGENKKSITFSILIQDYEKTITDVIALEIQNKIIKDLEKDDILLRMA